MENEKIQKTITKPKKEKFYNAGDVVEFTDKGITQLEKSDGEDGSEIKNIKTNEKDNKIEKRSKKKQKEIKEDNEPKIIEVQNLEAEKKLEEVREKYIEEYKKCKSEADRQRLIEKTRNATFNILSGVKNIFSKNKIELKKSIKPEDYFTDKTKEVKTEYDQARIEMGNVMYNEKKAELEKSGLSGDELEKVLINYKATEILAKTIIEEKQKIINMSAEKAPIKPVLWKKLLDGYRKLPRWQRVALSTALFTAAAGAGIVTGGVFAGYGLATMATMKFGASMAMGAFVGHSVKGIDLVMKKSDSKFIENQNNKKLELKDKFSKGEMGQEEYEKEIKILEKDEGKRDRNRILLKAGVGIALAGTVGFFAYDALGNGLNHIDSVNSSTVDAVSGPDISHIQPEIKIEDPIVPPSPVVHHINIEATANDGQGAISTLRELQNNLKVEYGNNLENAPESVKHILNTDAHKLAQEYGMYKPGEDAESAFIKSGSSFKVDENGNLTYQEVGSNESIILESGNPNVVEADYSGKMSDTDHSGLQTENTNPVHDESLNEYKLPEQVDEITGQPVEKENLINNENSNIENNIEEPINEDKIPEKVEPAVDENIVPENESNLNDDKYELPPQVDQVIEQPVENISELKNFEFKNPDHIISITDNNSSLNMQFIYDRDGKIIDVDIGGNINSTEPDPYVVESELDKLGTNNKMDAEIDIFKMRMNAEFLDKLPHDTYEYKFLHEEVVNMQKDIIKNYGDILNHGKLESGVLSININPENLEVNNFSHHTIITPEDFHLKGDEWNYLKENISAERLIEMYDKDELTLLAKDRLVSLINYIKKLEEVTNLKPRGVDIYHPDPETISDFINRAIMEAQEMGQLDKVKL